MSVRIDNLTPALVANAATTYFTASANERVLVKSLTFCNDDTVTRTVTVYCVPSGGTASATNQVAKAIPILSSETLDLIQMIGQQTLLGGGTVQALADVASKVSITGSVLRLT